MDAAQFRLALTARGLTQAHTLAVRLTSDIQTVIDWHNKERK